MSPATIRKVIWRFIWLVSKPERHSRDMGGGVVWKRQSQHTHTNETCTFAFQTRRFRNDLRPASKGWWCQTRSLRWCDTIVRTCARTDIGARCDNVYNSTTNWHNYETDEVVRAHGTHERGGISLCFACTCLRPMLRRASTSCSWELDTHTRVDKLLQINHIHRSDVYRPT